MKKILEVCTATIQSVVAAREGGAQRIELCSALTEDGLTPSYGMIEMARSIGPDKLHVLIRPRSGNFVYSEEEIQCMLTDITIAKKLGADGVVIGALTHNNEIDEDSCQRLIAASEGMQVTFHRAFDQCKKPLESLEKIISLGCHRLLTSGQARSAVEGIPLIHQLVTLADERIIIMPGAGVNPDNASDILKITGATEIHGSLRGDFNGRLETDPDKVKTLISRINEN